MGAFYSEQQRFKEAEEKLKEALSLKPLHKEREITIYYTWGSLDERKGELERAREKFEEVVKTAEGILSFEDKNRFIGGAHFHPGCIYQKIEEKEKAKREFEECLKLIPDHKKAKEVANSLLELGINK